MHVCELLYLKGSNLLQRKQTGVEEVCNPKKTFLNKNKREGGKAWPPQKNAISKLKPYKNPTRRQPAKDCFLFFSLTSEKREFKLREKKPSNLPQNMKSKFYSSLNFLFCFGNNFF